MLDVKMDISVSFIEVEENEGCGMGRWGWMGVERGWRGGGEGVERGLSGGGGGCWIKQIRNTHNQYVNSVENKKIFYGVV